MESLSLLASVSAIVGGAPASGAAAAASAPPNKSAGAEASATASTSGPKAAPTQPSKPRPQAGSPTPCLTFQTSFGGFQSKLPTFKPPRPAKSPAQRPKPYTDYTLFFRLEKSRLAQLATGEVDAEVTAALDPSHRDPLEFPRPAGYEDVVMPPFWYRSDERRVEKMRRHRKRRGRMDMATLSKTISKRWRECEQSEVRDYVRRLAELELERYEGEGVDDGKGGRKHRRERDGRMCLPKKRSAVAKTRRAEDSARPDYISRALQGHPPSMSPPHPTSSSGGMGVQIPRGSIGPFRSVRLPDGTVRLLEAPSAPASQAAPTVKSGISGYPGASGDMGQIPSRTSAGLPKAAAWVSSVESRLRALEEERRRRALEEDELRRALMEHRRQTRPAEALMIRGQEMMSDEEVQRRLLEQEERVAWQAEMRRRALKEEALLAREAEIRRQMVEEAEYRHRMMVEAAARARRMGDGSMEGTIMAGASGEEGGGAEGRLPLRKRGSRPAAEPSAEGSEAESKKRRTMDAVHHRLLAQLEQQAAERAAEEERSRRDAARAAEAELSQGDAAQAAMNDSSHGLGLAEPALDRAVSLSPGAEVFAARGRPR
ncbi:hypothetical protein ACHAXT_010973 [Thalassiosira profunda]